VVSRPRKKGQLGDKRLARKKKEGVGGGKWFSRKKPRFQAAVGESERLELEGILNKMRYLGIMKLGKTSGNLDQGSGKGRLLN